MKRKASAITDENTEPTAKLARSTSSATVRVPLQEQENSEASYRAMCNKIAELEAQLAKDAEISAQLGRENKKLSKNLQEAQAELTARHEDKGDGAERDELLDHIEAIEDELEQKDERIQELKNALGDAEDALATAQAAGLKTVAKEPEDGSIPHLHGTAGTDWSIQAEMGLGKTKDNTEFFKCIQRQLRDAAIGAHLDWTSRWVDIPMVDKAKFFLLV
ncbi:hypothetical protein H0H92_013916 [Tricholoma furcatifolium]|nr:hypothetical protein H0H92_013916 [Tricholoma furcatifolium]